MRRAVNDDVSRALVHRVACTVDRAATIPLSAAVTDCMGSRVRDTWRARWSVAQALEELLGD